MFLQYFNVHLSVLLIYTIEKLLIVASNSVTHVSQGFFKFSRQFVFLIFIEILSFHIRT
jgi:hypothetical protein